MASIAIALGTGYVVTLIVTATGIAPAGLMNLSAIGQHGWIELPDVVFPTFDFAGRGTQILRAIGVISPVAHRDHGGACGRCVRQRRRRGP